MAFKFLAPLAGLLLLVAGVQGQAVALGADCDGTTTTCADTATCQTTCKINVGEGCKPDSATELCVDNGECTGAASSETCSCKTGYAGTTTCEIKAGETCTGQTNQCVSNAECAKSSVCVCEAGYKRTTAGKC
ncbi:hypothetical protein BaRGS_00008357, partial [Batillaria attramentaria]